MAPCLEKRFPEEFQEVSISNLLGNHRADVAVPGRGVVEFQKSQISKDEIALREAFYDRMVWVIEAAGIKTRLYRRRREAPAKYSKTGKKIYTYRWSHFRKSWEDSAKPKYLDFGDSLFKINEINPPISDYKINRWDEDTEWQISGEYVTYEEFVSSVLGAVAAPSFTKKVGAATRGR